MSYTNWGIIGPGNIARQFAADLSLARTDQHIVAVSGRPSPSLDEFATEFKVTHRFTDVDEFIETGKPEMVYIATPHPMHFEEALACLRKKIPVLCEKPLCLNAEQAEQLVNTAKENAVFLMEAMWIRFLPGIQTALDLIEEGVIGDIISLHAAMHYNAPLDPGSRYFNPALGGGSLLDLGVYPVFLATLFLGEPLSIKSYASLTDKEIDESCSAIFQYNGGVQAMIESSLLKNENEPVVITGTKGRLLLLHPWFEKSPGVKIELNNGSTMIYPFSLKGQGLQFEIKEVLDCLQRKEIESRLMPHQLSLSIIKMMDEIRTQTGIKYRQFE